MVSELDRAYIAGLFDGEGCVGSGIRNLNGVPYVELNLAQKDPMILHWVAEITGLGYVQRFPQWHALVVGRRDEIRQFIKLIHPYSKIKRDQLMLGYAMAGLTGRTHERKVGGRRGEVVVNERLLARKLDLHHQLRRAKHAPQV